MLKNQELSIIFNVQKLKLTLLIRPLANSNCFSFSFKVQVSGVELYLFVLKIEKRLIAYLWAGFCAVGNLVIAPG